MRLRSFKEILRLPEAGVVGWCLVIFIVLQFYRKCYFLTDDNLTGWMPVAVEFCRRIFELQNPLYNDYLYGGVNLQMDVGTLSLLNPITLAVSVLSLTPFYYWIVDATAFLHIAIGAVFFYRLSRYLQIRQNLTLSPGLSTFLSLSWIFSAYSLSIGSSWVNFMGNMAALPLLLWGILHSDSRRSTILLFGGTAYSLFCGHMHPFLYSAAIFTVVVAAVAIQEKRYELVLRWIGIHLAVVTLALPILIPGFINVMSSVRPQIITISNSADMSMPALVLAGSMMTGPLVLLSHPPIDYFRMGPAWQASLAFSAAAFCFLCVLFYACQRRGVTLLIIAGMTLLCLAWKPLLSVLLLVPFFLLLVFGAWGRLREAGTTFWEKLFLVTILGLMLLIDRPEILSVLINKIPVYKMLHWPFREIMQLIFFMHVFLCFRIGTLPERSLRISRFMGILTMLTLPILGLGGGTLNPLDMDRKLIISGVAKSWWERNKAIDGEERWLPVIERKDVDVTIYDTPFSLLGAYNYPSLFRIRSSIGYWGTWIPVQGKLQGVEPYHWSGIIMQKDLDHLLKNEKFQYVRAKVLNGGEAVQVEAFGSKGINTMVLPINPPAN